MDPAEREKNVFLARLNGRAARFEAMKLNVKAIIDTGVEPTTEEHNLFSIVYSKLQHAIRDSWRVVSALEQEERAKDDEGKLKLVIECREEIENDLENLCEEVLSLVRDKISPNSTTDETRIFCLKMQGDYNRYVAECSAEPKRSARIEAANAAYDEAVKFAQENLDAGNPHRLSIVVNAAVFYHDFVEREEHAIELTRDELEKASEKIGTDGKDYDEVKAIIGILQANLQLWQAEDGDFA